MQLPEEFVAYTRQIMGEERFQQYLKSFDEEVPVSIRLNPMKLKGERWEVTGGEQVPWCQDGYYLPQRPNFTMDPLLHAGCYYVQEAASMFLDTVLRQITQKGRFFLCNSLCNERFLCNSALDLCAAPGGKSTLLRSVLPEDCVLYSNEPIRQRASILMENVTKWGYANHIVTNCYPKDYRRSKQKFDVILCDVPCSGEGMFRKDASTIGEWSVQNVEKCWRLQREIVADAWSCLNDGGLLIYSTCTFNTKENEENISWIIEELGGEVVPVDVKPEWHITGSLLEGFTKPVYRFIPGITRGEGLFMCILRKGKTSGGSAEYSHGGNKTFPRREQNIPTVGINSEPAASCAAELTYQQAIAYLRGEAVVLPPETPRGIVDVTFMGKALGQVKNIGTRANNLYPKPWRIKTTHIPTDYEAILRHT